MKHFVIQTLLFIILFGVVLFPICAYNKSRLSNALAKEQLLPPEKRVLALGDSHVECSMDESYFSEMVNRAKSSECYFFNLAKARYYHSKNVINTIIIAYNYFSLREGCFDSHLITEYANEFYPIYFPLITSQEDIIDRLASNFLSKEFIQYYCENKLGFPGKTSLNSFVHKDMTAIDFKGGFIDKYVHKLDEVDVEKTLNVHYKEFLNVPIFQLDQQMLEVLYEFCDYTKQNNVQLVLYNAPCHSEYNKRVPKDAIHKMDSLVFELKQKYNVIYLNYHDYPMPNDSCFRDYDHLNTRGAAIITPIVRDTLLKLGVI